MGTQQNQSGDRGPADLGMGITFAIASLVLLGIALAVDAGSWGKPTLLGAAALSAGLGVYGVCVFYDHIKKRKSFENFGVSAILGGMALCVAVVWQATRPSGLWLVVLVILMALLGFFTLMGIGMGVGEYVKESAAKVPDTPPSRSRRKARPPKGPRQTTDAYDRRMPLVTLLAAIISAVGAVIGAIIQSK